MTTRWLLIAILALCLGALALLVVVRGSTPPRGSACRLLPSSILGSPLTSAVAAARDPGMPSMSACAFRTANRLTGEIYYEVREGNQSYITNTRHLVGTRHSLIGPGYHGEMEVVGPATAAHILKHGRYVYLRLYDSAVGFDALGRIARGVASRLPN